ncbi:hypothetical protein A1F94_001740 [Pyrenophora tritici-repentis]|uniref:Uncharacterized protein n=1 Tax=Pyrenophora tritici-repentis TaxID=45151 RepID=A0A317A0P2_9PLEO|nr:hypothetical protein PtrV1_02343 [Pyrenophora tritici-repentis]KAF7455094.1 hypothetical protein A1F99_023520 [Pyrenophora tritici-repentis]KAF7578253.1 hypothetical protein PtrM4_024930 [Pyrenophora tritici-repentis]KAG9388847.1 hypothetical protein A1F94_001740 [Pyrenophora tritici-repentis]KAI1518047.1 hypothetical protein Ptr86124_003348 [Pyrenophora tritici-repentis]
MNGTSTNNVLPQVLNRIPWRFIYIPGLYLILCGGLTLSHAFDYVWMDPFPGWAVACSDVFAFLLGSFLVEIGLVICIAWYFHKDEHSGRSKGAHPISTDVFRITSEERALRSIVRRYPWRHARVFGLCLVIFTLLIIAHAMSLHRMNPDSVDWTTVLPIRFGIMLGIILQLGGFLICTGWYLFKDVRVDGAEGMQ